MVKGGAQEPRAELLTLRRRDEPKVRELDFGQAALEFAESQRFTLRISQGVDPTALRVQKALQFGARHLGALIPANRTSDESIEVEVLTDIQSFATNALRPDVRSDRCRTPGQLEICAFPGGS